MSERTVTLIGSEGQRETLACPGGPYFLGTNSGLWGPAPVLINARRLGGIEGEVVESVRSGPRDLVVPVRLTEPTDSELDNRLETLASMLRRGAECRIEVATTGTRNTRREITARYASGMESVQMPWFATGSGDTPSIKFDLTFRAHDPWWRDVVDPISTYGPEDFANAFGAGQNKIVIDTASTVPVWPTWRLTGVTENINVMSLRTMKYWRYIRQITSIGDEVEVRTNPRAETGAFYNHGARDWGFDAGSELFPLLPGQNTLYVSGLNSGGDSSIGEFEIEWVRRFDEP